MVFSSLAVWFMSPHSSEYNETYTQNHSFFAYGKKKTQSAVIVRRIGQVTGVR